MSHIDNLQIYSINFLNQVTLAFYFQEIAFINVLTENTNTKILVLYLKDPIRILFLKIQEVLFKLFSLKTSRTMPLNHNDLLLTPEPLVFRLIQEKRNNINPKHQLIRES